MTRIQTIRRAALATITLAAAHLAAPAVAHAQATLYACYVPATGSTYRIKTPDTPQACTKSTHVQFSWVDGADALRLPVDKTVNLATPVFKVLNNGVGNVGQFLASGSGTGVFGRGIGGTGVHGTTFGTAIGTAGVKAEAGISSGTALEITRGAIRMTGAGTDTPTAAFRTMADCFEKVVDHPMLNGNPDALVFASAMATQTPITPYGVAVRYRPSLGRWVLSTDNQPIDGTCFPLPVAILIVKTTN